MKLLVKDFNLMDSITSGQFFRYEIEKDSIIIILKDRVIKVKQDNNYLFVESNNMDNLEETIISFFSLNVNYNSLNKNILKLDPSFKDIIEKSTGFRIQRMDPFETTISYIISANNSVNNIRKCVNNISKKYGTKVLFNKKEYYLFPKINQIKNVTIQDLTELKLGFRAKYVKILIDKIINKEFDLNIINDLSSNDALQYLMKEKGIGLKVASCILLFSYSRFDVFPIDVWVKKIMKDRYNIEKENDIKVYMNTKYKEYSGLVIQYLFNYKRNII